MSSPRRRWRGTGRRSLLRHPGLAHAFDHAFAPRRDGAVAKSGSDPCNRELRIEREPSPGCGLSLLDPTEKRQRCSENEVTHRIVSIGLDGSSQPDDCLLVPPKVGLGDANKHQPIKGRWIARTEPESLLHVGFGLLGAAGIGL